MDLWHRSDLRIFGVGEEFLNVSKLGTKWDFKGTVICSMGREPYIVLSFVHKDIEEKISGQTMIDPSIEDNETRGPRSWLFTMIRNKTSYVGLTEW